MTDVELLEAAAKAHGGLARIGGSPDGHFFSDGPEMRRWSPLENDGDALRLAVKLGIEPRFPYPAEVAAVSSAGRFSELHDDDANAATRRAIVRAAAAMAS